VLVIRGQIGETVTDLLTGVTDVKKALKSKWVAALRSGEFKQARGTLVDQDYPEGPKSFCCLGVLCEISPAVKRRNTLKAYLSTNALGYVGFSAEVQEKLANFNDDEGYGFRRIATWIEKHL
jgi:hypothetical protein